MTNSIAEIEDAGCIFIIGSNTSACHPLIARRVFRAKEKGAKLIVADPRRIQMSRFADVAVNQRLGTDVALLNGMMHLILKNGWEAQGLYRRPRPKGSRSLREIVDGLYAPACPGDFRRQPPRPGKDEPSCTPRTGRPASCIPWA